MEKVSINKEMHLSEHFTLGEVTKTSVKTAGNNIPSHVAIENLKNLCENWLEDLRYSYNTLYPTSHREGSREISPRASLGRDDRKDTTYYTNTLNPRANSHKDSSDSQSPHGWEYSLQAKRLLASPSVLPPFSHSSS